MADILVNIDVDDLERAIRFYTEAFGLGVGRRLGPTAVELIGGAAPFYLLAKPAGSSPSPPPAAPRDYRRHWTPVHLDFVVDDLEAAVARAETAGARRESDIAAQAWGRIAMFSDPFGNGFCLLTFTGRGYDEIAT